MPRSIAPDDEIEQLNHDFRTALRIVLLTTEALQLEIFGPLTAQQQVALETLYANATHLQVLTEAILQGASPVVCEQVGEQVAG